jgi:hypothetical protein
MYPANAVLLSQTMAITDLLRRHTLGETSIGRVANYQSRLAKWVVLVSFLVQRNRIAKRIVGRILPPPATFCQKLFLQ